MITQFVTVRACLQGERVTFVLGGGGGYLSKRVKVSSGLQTNFTGMVTLSPRSTLPALLTCSIIRDILCNGPKFEIIWKFAMEKTLNSRNHRRQKLTFYFSDVYN